MMTKQDEGTARPENDPVAWFVQLQLARKGHDFERAATAQRELERLGVRVSYRRARNQQAKGANE